MKLKQVLEETRGLVSKSESSDWTPFEPDEIFKVLSDAIQAIDNGETLDKDTLKMHFCVTGPIQETSMANGWSDRYLELAAIFDKEIEKSNNKGRS
jgi:hypothetical protein